MPCTSWVLGEKREIVKSPEKVRKETVEKVSHEACDCQEIARGAQGVATEPNFTGKLPAMRGQFGVNRKSVPLLAMKYAIGEIIFLSVRFRRSMRPAMSEPRTTAESPSEVSHEVCNWQKLFSRTLHRCARVVGGERASATQSFLGSCGRTKIEVSHKRFDWPKIPK